MSTTEQPYEIYESWVNGNRSWVVGKVLGQKSKAKVAHLTAALCILMSEDERESFMRLLDR
jgi:hypothetical protein